MIGVSETKIRKLSNGCAGTETTVSLSRKEVHPAKTSNPKTSINLRIKLLLELPHAPDDGEKAARRIYLLSRLHPEDRLASTPAEGANHESLLNS